MLDSPRTSTADCPEKDSAIATRSPEQKALSKPGRWAGLLLPSFSDLFFISLMLWLFVSGDGWKGLLLDGDTGWHIRTGEWILDHGRVPLEDLYSFSKAGAEWFAWEWLADVTDALAFRAAGLKGVVLTAGVVIGLFGVILLRRTIWKGANAFAALAVTLLSVSAASIHYHARPHIYTLLLLPLALWMIEADRESPRRWIWVLIPLACLWTNLHGGFLVLVACLGLASAGEAAAALHHGWPGWRDLREGVGWRRSIRYGLLACGCAAASLLNPYGIRLHQHILAFLASDWIRGVIQEFQSPMFRGETMAHFELLLLAGLVAAGGMLRRREYVSAFWILFFAHSALGAARHAPLFAAACGPLLASEATLWWKAWTAGAPRRSIAGILTDLAEGSRVRFRWTSVWAFVLVACLAATDSPKWPVDFPDFQFPVKLVARHRAELAGARVLTYDQWADYLIFTSYPRQKVFFDGRSDFYGEKLGTQYLDMVQGQNGWDTVLGRWNFDYVLAPVKWPLVALLKTRPEWRVIEDDGKALLFVRRETQPGGGAK